MASIESTQYGTKMATSDQAALTRIGRLCEGLQSAGIEFSLWGYMQGESFWVKIRYGEGVTYPQFIIRFARDMALEVMESIGALSPDVELSAIIGSSMIRWVFTPADEIIAVWEDVTEEESAWYLHPVFNKRDTRTLTGFLFALEPYRNLIGGRNYNHPHINWKGYNLVKLYDSLERSLIDAVPGGADSYTDENLRQGATALCAAWSRRWIRKDYDLESMRDYQSHGYQRPVVLGR